MTQYKYFYKFDNRLHEVTFRNQKSAYQFERRLKEGLQDHFKYKGKPVTRMIKPDTTDHWEQYTVIGNQLVTRSDLVNILLTMNQEAQDLETFDFSRPYNAYNPYRTEPVICYAPKKIDAPELQNTN